MYRDLSFMEGESTNSTGLPLVNLAGSTLQWLNSAPLYSNNKPPVMDPSFYIRCWKHWVQSPGCSGDMYDPLLDALINTNFIAQADIIPLLPASTTQSQTNLVQTYTVIPTEQSGLPHVGGPAEDSNMQSFHVNNTLHDVSAPAVATTDLHAVPTPTCGLASGLHCTLPLDGSAKSIRLHLRKHGHRHSQRQLVQCPWTGCSAILRWMNIPRHIQSIHLGVRFRCFNCGKAYTRPEWLAVHTASLKCYGATVTLAGE